MQKHDVKEALRLAIKARGRLLKSVGEEIFGDGMRIPRVLNASVRLDYKFVQSVLESVGVEEAEFWAFVGGGYGDIRLHLASVMESAAGPELSHPLRGMYINRTRPEFEADELDGLRGVLSSRKISSASWWFVKEGGASEKVEGWSILGVLARARGSYRRAAFYQLRALEHAERDSLEYGRVVQRVGYLAQYLGQFELAFLCWKDALTVFAYVGSDEFLGRAYVDLARGNYFLGGDVDAGLSWFRRGLRFTADLDYRVAAHQGMGILLEAVGNYSGAIAAGCAALAEGVTKPRTRFYVHLLVGKCHLSAGDPKSAAVELELGWGFGGDVEIVDRLELLLVLVEARLESSALAEAAEVVERFSRVATSCVSAKFGNAYRIQLERCLKRGEWNILSSLQAGLSQERKRLRSKA